MRIYPSLWHQRLVWQHFLPIPDRPVVPTEKPVEEMVELKIEATDYLLLTPEADVILPAGFEKTEATIMNKKFSVWKPVENEDNEFYLIYAMNKAGIKGWYLFDTREETIQRFAEDLYNRNPKEEVVTAFQQNSENIRETRGAENKGDNGRFSSYT